MSKEGQVKRSEKIKEEIITTALQIGIEEGFESVTVRKISDKMEYTTGVIYHHFKDKQEIIDKIQMDASLEMKEKITSIINKEDGFFDNSKRIFHMIMELAYSEKEKYNLIVIDKYSKRRNESINQWIDMISESIQSAINTGEIKSVDVKRTAYCIWSSFLGFNLIISKDDSLSKEEAEKLFDTQISLVLEGLKR